MTATPSPDMQTVSAAVAAPLSNAVPQSAAATDPLRHASALAALHLMGYSAKTLSGRKCAHPLLRHAFCEPDETLVAFVAIGTPTRAAQPRGCDDLNDHWRIWQPDGAPDIPPPPSR